MIYCRDLGAFLLRGNGGGLALAAMVVTVVGHALGLVIGGISAFATPTIARLYLAGVSK